MWQRNRLRAGVCLVVLGLVVGANATDSPLDLPPVKVVATYDGWNTVCYGYECTELLNRMLVTLPPSPLPDIDQNEFCALLKTTKPEGCRRFDPPSTPDTDPNWQPNGCGNNWRVQAAMSLGILAIVPDDFAGNYNAPYSEVSFLDSCNRHDQCYGSAFDKAFCDERFGDEMEAACSAVTSSTGYNVCDGLAGIYKGAVASTTFGEDAYLSSVNQHTCAVWAKDMEANGC